MGGDDDVKGHEEGQADEPKGPQDQDDAQGEPEDGTQEGAGVGTPGTDYEVVLRERDARIRELEAQVASAAESRAAADELKRQIGELKEQAAAERLGFELRLAGCRDVKAAEAVLPDHGGKVQQLKADLPWMFGETAAPAGATGLEPAGTARGSDDTTMRRWEALAGLGDETKE